jgi:hypothetical protein
VEKRLPEFWMRSRAAGNRLPRCKPCEGLRHRRHQLATSFPALSALGVGDGVGALRQRATDLGYASAFELEVAARIASWGVDVEREARIFQYLDESGQFRRWTPDFATPGGIIIEAKGRVMLGAQRAIPQVLRQYPDLDVRFVFQRPHQHGDVEGSNMTPAEWADSLDARWTTLNRLELITMDLPRIVLTEQGDRVVPGWEDDGLPAQHVAALLWPEPTDEVVG